MTRTGEGDLFTDLGRQVLERFFLAQEAILERWAADPTIQFWTTQMTYHKEEPNTVHLTAFRVDGTPVSERVSIT